MVGRIMNVVAKLKWEFVVPGRSGALIEGVLAVYLANCNWVIHKSRTIKGEDKDKDKGKECNAKQGKRVVRIVIDNVNLWGGASPFQYLYVPTLT